MKIKKLYIATPDNSLGSLHYTYWSIDNWVWFPNEDIFAHHHKPTVPYKPTNPLFHVQFMDTCPECNNYISREMKDMLVFLNHGDKV